jgi:HSP20 family protein
MTPFRWWNPSGDLYAATRAMDRLFDEFFGPGGTSAPQQGLNGGEMPTYQLPVDILETEGSYVLTASVPGFDPSQVEVTFADGVLTILAKAQPEKVTGRWLRTERPHGSFLRKLELPQQVQGEKIAAGFENGLLTVTVPKQAKPEPIKIQVGGQKQLKG